MSGSGSETAKFLLHQFALRHNHPLPRYDTVCHLCCRLSKVKLSNILSCLLKDGRKVDAVTLVGRLLHARVTVT